MQKVKQIFLVLLAVIISFVLVNILYSFIEGIRLDWYCTELREGNDCYQPDWVLHPTWLMSFIGLLAAALSMVLTIIFIPKEKFKSAILTFLLGAIVALPLLLTGYIPYLVALLTGIAAVLLIKYKYPE